MNIVLHEPGIALNTGNIGRTCAATDTGLHLIKPYAFRITEKEIKRAGMDYWSKIRLSEYLDFEDFMNSHPELQDSAVEPGSEAGAVAGHGSRESETSGIAVPGSENGVSEKSTLSEIGMKNGKRPPRLWYATTKARQCYTDVEFGPDDFIMLGNESRGIPEEILAADPERCIRIPMWGDIRSLNLANSAAIILYEALRQNGFENMERYGDLHRLSYRI